MSAQPRFLHRIPPPVLRGAGRAAGVLGLAAAIYAVVGGARALMRETKRYRHASGILYRRWTSIPAITGTGRLRIHSRVRDVMTNRDAIVLVHGYGIGSSYFVPLAARLSHQAPVFAPDLPGHGPSDHDARPLDVAELAQALAHWMEAMGLRGAVVVGHSLGCQVALRLASTRPDLASRLVLIGPSPDASARSGLGQLRRSVRTPKVRCPVTIVRGGRDHIVSQQWAQRLAQEAGAPDPVLVPGWGHAVHYDEPEAVAAIILRA